MRPGVDGLILARPGGRTFNSSAHSTWASFRLIWFHSIAPLGSFWFVWLIALGFIRVIHARIGVAGFVRTRFWCRPVHGSFRRAQVVVRFFQARPGGHTAHSITRRGLCSLGLVGFIRDGPYGRRVHFGSLCSFGCALGIVGFIRAHNCGRRVHSGSLSSFRRVLGVDGFIRVRWFHCGAPCGSTGSFGFVGFIRVKCWWSLGSFLRALGVVGFVIRTRPGGPCVHLGSFWRALGVVGFTRVV